MTGRRARRELAMAAVAALIPASPARAVIIIDGTPEFRARVEACMERIRSVSGVPADVIDQLERSSRDHTIRFDPDGGSASTTATGPGANVAGGVPGPGAGTKVEWNPDFPLVYGDGVVRDPCAALFHEMVHSLDADQGTRDASLDPTTKIKNNEIKATTAENEYRDRTGLPQRTQYGYPLPTSAVRP